MKKTFALIQGFHARTALFIGGILLSLSGGLPSPGLASFDTEFFIGPDPGPIERLDCSDASALIVASFKNIIHFSLNGGTSWDMIRLEPVSDLTQLILNPWNDGTAWCTNGRDCFHLDLHTRIVTRIESMSSNSSSRLFIDPHRQDHLFMRVFPSSFNDVLIESSDAGRTWNPVNDSFRYGVRSMAFSPTDPDTVALIAYSTVLVTKDAFQTFHGMPLLPEEPSCIRVAQDGELVGFSYRYFFISHDDLTWNWKEVDFMLDDIALWNGTLDIIFGLDHGGWLLRSTDEGSTWQHIEGLPSVMTLTSAQDALFIGTSEGVLKSIDAGQTFVPVNTGLRAAIVNQLAVDPLNSSIYYAATNSDLFRSNDEGITWQALDITPKDGIPQGVYFADYDQERIFFSCHFVDGHRLYRSDDALNSIEIFWISDETSNLRSSAHPIYMSDTDETMIILEASASHYHSAAGTDNRSNIWKYQPVPEQWINLFNSNSFEEIATVSLNNPDMIMLLNFYFTFDGGQTWTDHETLNCYLPLWKQLRVPGERYLGNGYDDDKNTYRINMFDLETGNLHWMESDSVEEFLVFDDTLDDFLFAGTGVNRHDPKEFRGIPIGSTTDAAHQILLHPDHPSRLLVVWENGGISEIPFDREAVAPTPPYSISVDSDEESLSLAWRLPEGVSGTRVFIGSQPGMPEQVLIVPDHQESIKISIFDMPDISNYAFISLTAYSSSGRESVRSDEIQSPIGPHTPIIEMFGNRTVDEGPNRSLIITALIRDPQGVSTIHSVYLFVNDQPTGIPLQPTGSIWMDRGIFEARIPISVDFSCNSLVVQFEVVDENGNHSRSRELVPVSQGDQWGTCERPINFYY